MGDWQDPCKRKDSGSALLDRTLMLKGLDLADSSVEQLPEGW